MHLLRPNYNDYPPFTHILRYLWWIRLLQPQDIVRLGLGLFIACTAFLAEAFLSPH